MQTDQLLTFGPYRFDPHTGQLWRGKQEVSLTKKAIALLHYLLERAGQVVAKEELFAAVWADTVVSDAALTSCIQELRQALHDNARKPRYIETVHRRGFRFLGKVVSDQLSVVSREEANQKAKGKNQKANIDSEYPAPNTQHPAPLVVGRDAELAQLHQWLAKALNGERQIVFVTGEPGIGKTTLVDVFVSGVRRAASNEESQNAKVKGQKSKLTNPQPLTPNPQIARGQCIEHYGAGEAYLPILEALGRLCRATDGERLLELLQQHAPTWLVQMPTLFSAEALETLQRKTQGATRERMLREFAEALEVITADRPLVLVLEDLHWSDVSTVDVLSLLAHRQDPARLMIIGTYRPVEVLTRDHPLKGIKQELHLHGQCEELALDFLSEAAVAEYLTVRFSAPSRATAGEGWDEGQFLTILRKLSRLIHQRTDGNPLFMVNMINKLVIRGIETQQVASLQSLEDLGIGVPENLRQLIEQQLGRVNQEEREVLEVASVVGAEFSAAAVAAGTGHSVEAVETHCDNLVRREQFLCTRGTTEWPDGTTAARYGFVHALYQEVLYTQLAPSRRTRLHRQIGQREQAGYGAQAREIAAELALHFERGRDYGKAAQYLQTAGENALRRSAHHEAISLFTKGLELLKTLPQSHEHNLQELILQNLLGAALMVTKGWAAPAVEKAYSRALELCNQIGETPQRFSALEGLFAFALVRAELQTALELAEQCLTVAQSMKTSPVALLWAHQARGETVFYLGEFASAHEHFVQGIALYDSQKHNPYVLLAQVDPGVVCLSWEAQVLWYLGYPSQSQRKMHEAFMLAEKLLHPFSCAYVLSMAAELHQFREEAQLTQERAKALVTLSTEQGFSLRAAEGTLLQGWALAMQGNGKEGIPRMGRGLEAWQATGANIGCPYQMALLAEAYGKMGQVEEGLRILAEALALMDRTKERWWEAAMYRLRGELTLAQSGVCSPTSEVSKSQRLHPKSQAEAEGYFLKAIEIAQQQQAKSLELRAAASLARLWQSHGKKKRAHNMLSAIYNWFTEGFDTKDLQEAKALLDSFAACPGG